MPAWLTSACLGCTRIGDTRLQLLFLWECGERVGSSSRDGGSGKCKLSSDMTLLPGLNLTQAETSRSPLSACPYLPPEPQGVGAVVRERLVPAVASL